MAEFMGPAACPSSGRTPTRHRAAVEHGNPGAPKEEPITTARVETRGETAAAIREATRVLELSRP